MPRTLTKDRRPEDVFSIIATVGVIVTSFIIVTALYFGREIFVPVALAILLSFVLAPAVGQLQRIKVPRAIAAISVVVIAFAIIFALGSLMAAQLGQLANDLPRYQSTIQTKIQSVRGATAGSETLERAAGMLHDLSKELDRPKSSNEPHASDLVRPRTSTSQAPVPVEVRQPDPGALENLRSLIAPLISPLTTTGIIVIFVIFILLQREDLRNRLIRLAGSHDLQRTTAALDDAARRLSRLFLTQLIVNTGFGILVGVGLAFIGVPSPVLWGILTTVLRFVPYIGSIIAGAFPLILAAAVDPGWTMLIYTAILFFIVQPAIGQVVEPIAFGRSTGLSPIAVVASTSFWTALWGPIGLVLATPLTVCLVVLGRHVERLEFLDVMFGDKPALSPPEIFYQRMLAGDPSEAAEKAEQFLKERSLVAYYDDVALPGLQLAQNDLNREVLGQMRLSKIRDAVREFTADLPDADENSPSQVVATADPEAVAAIERSDYASTLTPLPVLSSAELSKNWLGATPVLCIAGRTLLDEAAGIMFLDLCKAHGLAGRAEGPEALSTANILQLQTDGVALVCVSFMNGSALAPMRFAVRRVRRKFPKAFIMLGCWGQNEQAALAQLQEGAKAHLAVGTLRQAVEACIEAAQPHASAHVADLVSTELINAQP